MTVELEQALQKRLDESNIKKDAQLVSQSIHRCLYCSRSFHDFQSISMRPRLLTTNESNSLTTETLFTPFAYILLHLQVRRKLKNSNWCFKIYSRKCRSDSLKQSTNWTKELSKCKKKLGQFIILFCVYPLHSIVIIMTLTLILYLSVYFFTITIRALERTRTITSVSLSEERQILKEISSIKRIKPQVEEYNKMDEKVQVVKVCLQLS